MKKTALCFFGQMRDVVRSCESWNLHFNLESFDVFIHTWDDGTFSNSDEQLIIQTFKPKVFVKEKQKDFGFNFETSVNISNFDRSLLPTTIPSSPERQKLKLQSPDREWYAIPHNTLSMLYSRMQSCFLSRTTGEFYESVLSSRLDIAWQSDKKIKLPKIIDKVLMVPSMPSTHPGSRIDHFVCDHWMFGDIDSVFVASDAYHNYHTYYFMGVDIVPEIVLGAQIFSNQLNLQKINKDNVGMFSYKLLRDIQHYDDKQQINNSNLGT
jgi:hypothetical protein